MERRRGPVRFSQLKYGTVRRPTPSPHKPMLVVSSDHTRGYRSPYQLNLLRQSFHSKRDKPRTPTHQTVRVRPSSVQDSFLLSSMERPNPDWAHSPLNTSGLAKPGFHKSASPVQRGLSVIEGLRQELQMPNFPKVKPTVKNVRRLKQQLLDVRSVTVTILRSIKEREELTERLLAQTVLDTDLFNKYLLVSSKVQTLISNWKDLNNPFTQFVYNGQDYNQKIEDDTKMLQTKLGRDC